ncbi:MULTISPECIES: hypothetical protein [unclassified Methylosinus]|uniref:hypothetical protein n=1 Tax=unclassified Methylosinus TaxID=2624500 RepID=UPI00140D7F64|nr:MULTISPECIES: hypothetical protein [unclassified Methylosinus]MBU3887004.1 hypothetical protein [Methylosinus sp. KRF6]
MDQVFRASNSPEVIELYRLMRALLALRDMFDGAYERAVLSMLPEATRKRFDRIANCADDHAGVAVARPILDDSYDALEAVFDEYKHEVAESLLAAALADTVADLPEKLGALEKSLLSERL